MTDREVQVEVLWTYEISKEKGLKQLAKKGTMAQTEANELSDRMLGCSSNWMPTKSQAAACPHLAKR